MKTKLKSTPSTRLGTYLTVGVGLGTLAGSADAALVNIDISATGYNIGGDNGGVTQGSKWIGNFTSTGTNLYLWNDTRPRDQRNGLVIEGTGAGIAVSSLSTPASPHNFATGELIGPYGGSTGVAGFSNRLGYSRFLNYTNATTEFSTTPGYIGFKNTAGDFGWLKVTWDPTKGTSGTFNILAGAYNDTAGVAIKAGESFTAVPEPASVLSTMGLLASGLLLRRRKLAV